MPLNPLLVEAPDRFVRSCEFMLRFIDLRDPDTAAMWARNCYHELIDLLLVMEPLYADFE